jgi:predicted MFS family arabinose efflux permease
MATEPGERGRASGAFNLSFDIGISAGPILGGTLTTLIVGLTPFSGGLLLVALALVLLLLLGSSAHAD